MPDSVDALFPDVLEANRIEVRWGAVCVLGGGRVRLLPTYASDESVRCAVSRLDGSERKQTFRPGDVVRDAEGSVGWLVHSVRMPSDDGGVCAVLLPLANTPRLVEE